MTVLVIVLILAVLVLAGVLFVTVSARKRDRRLLETREAAAADKHYARADTTEELARERAARERAEADLHEARLRIVGLEQRRDALEADAGETAGRPGLLYRASPEIPPEDAGRQRARATRGS